MSRKTINQILYLAAVDQEFWKEVQQNPLDAAQARGLELTPEEQDVLSKIRVKSLSEFCRRVLEQIAPETDG